MGDTVGVAGTVGVGVLVAGRMGVVADAMVVTFAAVGVSSESDFARLGQIT